MAGPITIRLLRGLGEVALGVLALTASAAAQNQGAPNQVSTPLCVQLETQLAAIDGGTVNPARTDQINRAEAAIANQQAALDRTVAAAERKGCQGQGFFALFSGLAPQCGAINSQIQQMRSDLDRMMSDLEQLKSGSSDQEGQRRAVIGELAQNNCGPQYTAAASTAGPRGFFEALFGNGTIVNPGGDGAPSGTYQTVCVRTCDGYYFPISYSTQPDRFPQDQRTCQRLCPASEVMLYTFRNPGEEVDQAVSISGAPYTALPNAFRYRKELVPGCSCRRPGQSWADALKNADDSTTLESGDIVVTDQNAKALSQAPRQPGKPTMQEGANQPNANDSTPVANAATPDPAKRKVRVVGPPFLSSRTPTVNQQ